MLEDGGTTKRLYILSFMHFPEFSSMGEEEEDEDGEDEGGWRDEFVPVGRVEEGRAER